MPILEAANEAAQSFDRTACLDHLRKAGFDDFGSVLFSLPIERFPDLAKVLPRMATEETQERWTSTKGRELLNQSLGIVRIFESIYWRNAKKPLSAARILDFGCGYGRLVRLMYFHQDPASVFGCDPWENSIILCEQSGLTANISKSDYLPDNLPYEDQSFDFIYAFSVFTHLSERATRQCLAVLRRKIKNDGVLVITVRPTEYWKHLRRLGHSDMDALEAEHRRRGFSFKPHDRAPVDGDITYGETTMTAEYISKHFPDWKPVAVERQLIDPLQLFVTLLPK